MFFRLPTGFLPTEDQGAASIQFRLPARRDADPNARSADARSSNISAEHEAKNIQTLFTVAGGGGAAARAARTPARASSTSLRGTSARARKTRADAIVERASGAFRGLRDAQVFALGARRDPRPRPVERLHHGAAEPQRHEPRAVPRPRATSCSQLANADPKLTSVRLSDLPDVATLKIDVDQQKLTALGLNQNDVNTTLSTAWGGRYVNDFIDQGRVKRVYVQGDAPYRADPSSLGQWYVRSSNGRDGALLVLRARPAGRPRRAACRASRASLASNSRASRRRASARARRWTRCERLAGQIPGTSVAWAGQSYQERLSSGQAPLLYAHLAAGRVPVPRRALRKLVDPGRGPAGHPARPGRRDLRGHAARAAERRLPADRPADDHGPRGEERDPDDRVRRAGGEARACGSSTPRWKPRGSACGRS